MNKFEDFLAKLVAYIIVMCIMGVYMPYYWLFEHKYWKKDQKKMKKVAK